MAVFPAVSQAAELPGAGIPVAYLEQVSWNAGDGFQNPAGTGIGRNIPDSAYPEPSDVRWSCQQGHEVVRGQCVPLMASESGYLADSGIEVGPACEHGDEAAGDACAGSDVQASAYLSASHTSPGPACEPGEDCVARDEPDRPDTTDPE